MSARNNRQAKRARRAQRRASSHEWEPGPTPEGYVEVSDGEGDVRLVYAPGLRQLMREHCPICAEEAESGL